MNKKEKHYAYWNKAIILKGDILHFVSKQYNSEVLGHVHTPLEFNTKATVISVERRHKTTPLLEVNINGKIDYVDSSWFMPPTHRNKLREVLYE